MRNYMIVLMMLLMNHSSFAQKDSTWYFSTTGFYNIIPSEENSVTFIGYADYKRFHLEVRYNYEDRNTLSVFGGYRFEIGNKFKLGITPMIGGLFFQTNGVALGLELEASYRKFDYYSETEYVFDFSSKDDWFFYTWGEVAISPIGSLRTGLSYQRTRLYQTDFEVQRGIFAEYAFKKLTLGSYYFNPLSTNNFIIISLGWEF